MSRILKYLILPATIATLFSTVPTTKVFSGEIWPKPPLQKLSNDELDKITATGVSTPQGTNEDYHGIERMSALRQYVQRNIENQQFELLARQVPYSIADVIRGIPTAEIRKLQEEAMKFGNSRIHVKSTGSPFYPYLIFRFP